MGLMPRKADPVKHCANCKAQLQRYRMPSGELEGYARFLQRQYCTPACAKEARRKAPRTRQPDPKRYCRYCKRRLRRKVYNGRLEDMGAFCRRQFCDFVCMGQSSRRADVSKSTHHRRAKKFLKPSCERCGSGKQLEAHHRDEDWKNDQPGNIETVCKTCHGKEHGPKRGEFSSRRMYIEKTLLRDMWIALREASASVRNSQLAERIDDLLHRGGQLV